jgi:antirestriction protein ArdC
MQGYFGDDSYAFEELVAEIGAAVQCCILGITSTPKKESAQYLKSWIKRIKDDPDALFKASAKANQAVKFIEELQENKKQIVKDPELKADKNKVAWIQKVPA